jgi:RNA polymerase sigma-70 factor (ECF subfamily)
MGDDELLLAKALSGAEDAFTALYRRHQAAIYRFALHMSGEPALAEDVTQEVFLALLRNGRQFDGRRGALRSFLYGIARHCVLRRLPSPQQDLNSVDQDHPSEEDLLGDLARHDIIERVRRAVLSLPPSYREAVVLCDLEEATYDEAAAALGCPVGTIRSRLNRGRAMLAQKLEGAVVRSSR